MYTTKKTVGKAANGYFIAPIIIIFGIIRIIMSANSRDFNIDIFQLLGDNITSILMIVFGVYTVISASKKIKELKKESFDIIDDSFIYVFENKKIIFNKENRFVSIEKKLNTIDIITIENNLISIKLDKYLLYEELQEVKDKIIKLNSTIKIELNLEL